MEGRQIGEQEWEKRGKPKKGWRKSEGQKDVSVSKGRKERDGKSEKVNQEMKEGTKEEWR